MFSELILEPGDLAALLSVHQLALDPASVLPTTDLLIHPASSQPPTAEGLLEALGVLAQPTRVLMGRRGARRNQPWPFWLFLSSDLRTVLLAPEGGGYARLRFGYQHPALLQWLAGPFARFAKPEIGWTELPPLAASGLAVLLGMVDLFRHRFPELDPDWAHSEPLVFELAELVNCLESADPSCIWNGLAGFGLERPAAMPPSLVESILYVFANEGLLEFELGHSEPIFRFTEAFVGLPLSLAWWDLSLSFEVVTGDHAASLRLIQALALWCFESQPDGRIVMRAISGQELHGKLQEMIFGATAPQPHSQGICSQCRQPVPAHYKFCGHCGSPVSSAKCARCGHSLEPNTLFCPECGSKRGESH